MDWLRVLHSVGIKIFIQYHHLWGQPTSEVVEQLCKCGVSNENGAKRRDYNAKKLINSVEDHKKCLEYIVHHANVPAAYKTKAEENFRLITAH